MSPDQPEKVVFDCPIYAPALINPRGPAAACVTHAQNRLLVLFVSDYVLNEIRELPGKLKVRLGVTPEAVERFIHDLAKYAQPVDDVPEVYVHPWDADDSHYINLALATRSRLVVSRDKHLLGLMDANRPEATEFMTRFPSLKIVEPTTLLRDMSR
jgi:putative PIN family toxin of toxin-antitoxin system